MYDIRLTITFLDEYRTHLVTLAVLHACYHWLHRPSAIVVNVTATVCGQYTGQTTRDLLPHGTERRVRGDTGGNPSISSSVSLSPQDSDSTNSARWYATSFLIWFPPRTVSERSLSLWSLENIRMYVQRFLIVPITNKRRQSFPASPDTFNTPLA